LDAKGCRNVGQIVGGRGVAGRVEIVQARANLVDEGGREGGGVAEGALLGDGRLRPLLEAAAVGDAAKDAGNELRVVDQAEAVEQLVLFVEVDVHARVERVAVFEQLGRSSEVGEERTNRVGRGGRIELQQGD